MQGLFHPIKGLFSEVYRDTTGCGCHLFIFSCLYGLIYVTWYTSHLTEGPFFVAYQNLPGRCLVCKHGSHVINIPKADWSSVKNKQLTATPC